MQTSQGHLRLLASLHTTTHTTASTVAEFIAARQSSTAPESVPRIADPTSRPLDLVSLPARLLQPYLDGYPAAELAWLERHAQERVRTVRV